MARVIDSGPTGKIGNLIFYNMYGKKFVRTMPSRVKQTKATKARATEFGKASTIGAGIRSGLNPVIPDASDRKMQIRLVSVVFQWLNQLSDVKSISEVQPGHLSIFSFREKGETIRGRWKVNINVGNPSPGLVEISVPAFTPMKSFEAPPKSVSVVGKIATVSIDVKSGMMLGKSNTEMHFILDNESIAAQKISQELPTPKGCLIVTGMRLVFMNSKFANADPNTNKAYMPAEIVEAKYL